MDQDSGPNSRPKIGALTFRLGLGIVVEQFNPFKETSLLGSISARERELGVVIGQARACAEFKPYNPHTFFRAVNSLRFATVKVIQEILHWRNGLVHPEPFMVAGENYLLKLIHDTEILRVMPCVDLFSFEIGLRNPFLFPCMPRIALREALQEKQKKQAAEKKKQQAQEARMAKFAKKKGRPAPKPTLAPVAPDAHVHVLEAGEMILPRSKDAIETLVPDKDLATLMHDLSVVTEEHWILICECEAVLKEEEERYAAKQIGVGRAGTGWGLERWTKMPWKAPNAPKRKPAENASEARAETWEGEEEEEEEGGEKETHREPQHDHVERKKKKPETTMLFSEFSKAEQEKMMADALRSEEKAMEAAGRSKGIPSCASLINELEDQKVGKSHHQSHRKTASAAGEGSKGGEGVPSPAPTPAPAHSAPAKEVVRSQAGENKLAQLPGSSLAETGKKKKKVKSRRGKRSGTGGGTGGASFKTPPESPWDFDPSIEILDDMVPTTSD